FSDFSLLIFLNPPVLNSFLRGIQGLSPELVHARKQHGLGLWLTQSDARYLCGQRRRAFFLCSGILNACLTRRKENPMSLHLRSGFVFS
ncbi:hypothetical protein AALD74_20965, partial [Lachnospiraceae bacterium 48-21]